MEKDQLTSKGQSTGRKDDSAKAPMALIPPIALEAAARAFQNGLKYGQFNYLRGLEATRILSALLRHVSKWNAGEEIDPDSGVHHLGHAIACCAMLLHLQQTGKLVDDRWRPDGTEPPDFCVYKVLAQSLHEGGDIQAPRSPGAAQVDRRTVCGDGTLSLEVGKWYRQRKAVPENSWLVVSADSNGFLVRHPKSRGRGLYHSADGRFDCLSDEHDLVEEIDAPDGVD